MKIAVDAMGGDRAPEEILLGVSDAIEAGYVRSTEVILVGQEERLEPLVAACPPLHDVEREHAPDVVDMAESPTGSLRKKPQSSIQVALRRVQSGEAAAFVSAGNTGAVVASAWSLLGRLPGVRRPGIGVTFRGQAGPVVMLDVGANVHCKPLHLFQYGVMADIFLRDVFGVASPRIALLNIGEEEKKGNELVRETRELFENSTLNFAGNIEGTDILSGKANAIVCEGFVGNVVLKVTEGIGAFFRQSIAKELAETGDADSPLKGALRNVTAKLDYAEYGGAPLLGVNGLVMIMHGRSDRRAMANALRASHQFIARGVNDHIRNAIESALGGATETGEGR